VIRVRSFQTIVVLLSVLLLLPGQVIGTVLCIGKDGHMALEVAKQGRCGTFSTPALSHEQITKALPSTDHCGPCVDVSLSADSLDDQQQLATPSSLPRNEASVLALVPVVIAVYTEPIQSHFALQPPSFPSTLTALRTVILLV
jgi:hypothetical protein